MPNSPPDAPTMTRCFTTRGATGVVSPCERSAILVFHSSLPVAAATATGWPRSPWPAWASRRAARCRQPAEPRAGSRPPVESWVLPLPLKGICRPVDLLGERSPREAQVGSRGSRGGRGRTGRPGGGVRRTPGDPGPRGTSRRPASAARLDRAVASPAVRYHGTARAHAEVGFWGGRQGARDREEGPTGGPLLRRHHGRLGRARRAPPHARPLPARQLPVSTAQDRARQGTDPAHDLRS